jgi:hypothetical protein
MPFFENPFFFRDLKGVPTQSTREREGLDDDGRIFEQPAQVLLTPRTQSSRVVTRALFQLVGMIFRKNSSPFHKVPESPPPVL